MTYNPVLRYVQDAIDYIEDQIANPIDANSIAEHISISVSYLKKIFKSVTDISLIEYARARKLNHCLCLLSKTEETICEIALKNGYVYEQSFSRAFKKKFGISPKNYRENTTAIELTPKLDLSFIYEVKDAMIVKPIFKRLPSFKIGGLLHRVSIEEKYKYKPSMLAKDFHLNQKKLIQNPVRDDDYYGYTSHDPYNEDSTFYLTGLKVDENTQLFDYHHVIDIPEQDYIVFKFIGNFDPIEITWEHLKSIWDYRDKYLHQNPHIKKSSYGYFEYIDTRKCSESYCELSLFVPINMQ